MKKFLGLIIILSLLFTFHITLASEKIDDFSTLIKINRNSSLNIEENITYDFDNSFGRHGIYRDIPIRYKARGGNYNLSISNISVVDRSGNPYKFKILNNGKYKRIKIGNPYSYVSGRKTYIIKYTVKRGINYFKDHDELYWNVTGNEWNIPIISSSAKIVLPETINKNKLQIKCFSGPLGSRNQCLNKSSKETNGLIKEVDFWQNNLSAREGLTIVVGFPKSLVIPPTFFQNTLDTVKDNLIALLPILTFIILFALWWKNGRDPKGKKTIIARYEPPDSLTPVEVGTIIDEKVDNIDISSEIIYLATQGYLKIKRIEEKHLIFKSKDYLLEQLKDETGLENNFDKQLLKSLFKNASLSEESGNKTIKLSQLKTTFSQDIKQIQKDVYQSTVEKGYFPKNPSAVRKSYITIGIIVLILIGFLASSLGFITIVSIGISAIFFFLFGNMMARRTKKGVLAKEAILGFKLYLSVAEKARLEFQDAPQKNPQLFEKFLPYAIALKVEREWAKQFEDIYLSPPSWYEGWTGANFTAFVLVDSLSGFRDSTNHLLSAASQGAGSGISGFGGGGFSGGGFGGGGGGSW